jgi:anti-anti-sigma factor
MKENIMENIAQEIKGDIVTNRVNLLRTTVNEANEIRDLLEEQIVYGHSKIVIDLSQCSHLDSTFIGVLVVNQKKLQEKGGELNLVEPLDPAKELFYLTGVSKMFNTFETAEEAIISLNNGKKPPEPKPVDVIPRKKVEWAFA